MNMYVNDVYMPHLNCPDMTQIFFGGSSSGKSYFLADRIVLDCIQGVNTLVTRNIGLSLRKSSFNEITKSKWKYLSANIWSAILKEFDQSFIATVTYPDMVNNRWTTRKMYCGDRAAKPFKLGEDGLPVSYIDCNVNLVDTGA